MHDVTVEGVIVGLLKTKCYLKLKISAARKRGFEAEIRDLYIGENGDAT